MAFKNDSVKDLDAWILSLHSEFLQSAGLLKFPKWIEEHKFPALYQKLNKNNPNFAPLTGVDIGGGNQELSDMDICPQDAGMSHAPYCAGGSDDTMYHTGMKWLSWFLRIYVSWNY